MFTSLSTIRTRKRSRCKGLTVIEMLMAAFITSCLMAAVAVAMYTSITGYRETQLELKTSETAHSILDMIARQVRTSSNCSFTVNTVLSDLFDNPIEDESYNITTLVIDNPKDTTDLEQIKYVYFPGLLNRSGKIYYCYKNPNESIQVQSMPLLGYNKEISVTRFDLFTESDAETNKVLKTKVSITVKINGKARVYSRSIVPRTRKL